MPATYESLATTTLGSAQATVTFSSISGSFTDLILVMQFSQTPDTATNGGWIRLNGDTASNYSVTRLSGNGTSPSSDRSSSQTEFTDIIVNNSGQNNTIVHFMNYANTTTNKTVIARANASTWGTRATVGLWRKTPEAINSITIGLFGGQSYTTGSTFTLYGIRAA